MVSGESVVKTAGGEVMDNTILKKRLSTFKTEKGILKNVSDELLGDILRAWESWPGNSKDFYTSIGVSFKQMAKLMGKAKKLHREGRFPEGEFKELTLESASLMPTNMNVIEVGWEKGKVIRFCQVEQLVEFLKKVA